MSLEGANSIFHCMIDDVLHLGRANSSQSMAAPVVSANENVCSRLPICLLISEEGPQPGLCASHTHPKADLQVT